MPKLPANYDSNEIERAIDQQIWPFASRNIYSITSLPTASSYPYLFLLVSDGTSNRKLIQSDASVWRYLDGTAV